MNEILFAQYMVRSYYHFYIILVHMILIVCFYLYRNNEGHMKHLSAI